MLEGENVVSLVHGPPQHGLAGDRLPLAQDVGLEGASRFTAAALDTAPVVDECQDRLAAIGKPLCPLGLLGEVLPYWERQAISQGYPRIGAETRVCVKSAIGLLRSQPATGRTIHVDA